MTGFTREQLQADIEFLLLRSDCAGSCSFSSDRWTGMSSNSLVSFAYGGEHDYMPSDRSDFAACVRTVRRLPTHRRTKAVLAALQVAKEAYLASYPAERFPGTRKADRERRERENAEWKKRHRRRRKAA